VTLIDALRDALQDPHADTSQQRVHSIVAGRLQELTNRTTVRTTGYFNHSWAPDFVLSSGDQPERGVFLRFGVRDATFADDLNYLASDGPMFLDLEAANPNRPERLVVEPDEPGIAARPFDLVTALTTYRERTVLVTEAPAIDGFESRIAAHRDVKTATQQVILGGHGWVDEQAAHTIADGWEGATAAVAEGHPPRLREALNAVEDYLSRVASLDLETALRARWLAAGQPAEDFPGREDWQLNDRAPWELARLVVSLVDQETAVPPERWTEIAEAVSLSDLGHELYQIGEYREGGAVNDLARAGLPLWTAQYAYVPPLPSDTLQRFQWSFGDYSLALNLVSRWAYFTDLGKKWSRVPRATVLPDARQRLEALRSADVKGVGLTTPEEDVQHALRPDASMSLAQRLEQFLGAAGDPAWRAARLTSLEMRVPGTGAMAHIDYKRSVVRTTDPVPLRTLTLICARYIAGLSEAEVSDLERGFDARAAPEA
jgi:hypothetical protein